MWVPALYCCGDTYRLLTMDGDVEDGSSTTGRPESEEESQVRKRVRVDEGAAAASASTDIDVSNLRYDPDNQNRFGLFADLQIENVEVDNSSNIQIAPRSQRVEPAKKKSFCPPIFLHNVNIKRLVQQLEAKSPKIDFKIKNVSKTKSKLYFSDVNVHTTMMALLRERGVHSYSYTPKDLKQMSLVLRGLYHGQDVEDVKVALDSAIPGAVSRVAKFTTPHSLKNKTDTGLFLINLVPGKGLNDVQHIRYLLSQTITWEIPKKRSRKSNVIGAKDGVTFPETATLNLSALNVTYHTVQANVNVRKLKHQHPIVLIATFRVTRQIGKAVPCTKDIFYGKNN